MKINKVGTLVCMSMLVVGMAFARGGSGGNQSSGKARGAAKENKTGVETPAAVNPGQASVAAGQGQGQGQCKRQGRGQGQQGGQGNAQRNGLRDGTGPRNTGGHCPQNEPTK
jgi:hypothetical protein